MKKRVYTSVLPQDTYTSKLTKELKAPDNATSSLVDRWLVFVISEFVSAAIGFAWGLFTHSILFLFIAGFFFSLGVFAATRLGFDRWKAKHRPRPKRRR
jgi:hypothetical protein